MQDIVIRVNRDSPAPLYHQVAEAIRYRIATGHFEPGARLPALSRAAEQWGVNLHTVRRAYAELASAGLVITTRPGGSRVAPGGVPRPAAEQHTGLQRFVWRVVREAGERFQLSAGDLADTIRSVAAPRRSDLLTVVECSELQATEYARQITERWRVVAEPWSLDWAGEPPPGRIVTTYFHYNDVRRVWPERADDFVFLAVRPDTHLRRALERHTSEERLVHVVLCETDESRSHNVVADFGSFFPTPPFRVESRAAADPSALLQEPGEMHVVFPPTHWARLLPEQRNHSRAHQLRYVLEAGDLEALGRELGWTGARGGLAGRGS